MMTTPKKNVVLDVSELLTLSDSEIVIAKIIAEETEKERERKRDLIEKPTVGLGLGINPYGFLNSQNWEELLTSPSIVAACSDRAGISRVQLLEFALTKCNPKNWNAIFWMFLTYQLIDEKHLIASEMEAIQKGMGKKYAEEATRKARAAAEARYSKPGEAWDLKKQIQESWATGNFATREECADQEWEGIGFGTMGSARKALQGTPNPSPWPAKRKKISKK
jgi:hypothetical protein